MKKKTDHPITEQVRQVLLGIVIHVGKTEQANSKIYQSYKLEAAKGAAQ